jgi:hypothetical protein
MYLKKKKKKNGVIRKFKTIRYIIKSVLCFSVGTWNLDAARRREAAAIARIANTSIRLRANDINRRTCTLRFHLHRASFFAI